MSNTEEIKARLDIIDLVSETVQLRRSGKNYTGFCPFHDNKRTPAFVVFPETGTWRCFGQCGDGGDIFKFMMKKEGWDFPEALRALAERAGVQLTAPTPQQQEQTEENERLRELLEDAVTFFRHHLTAGPAGKQALDYMYDRGLDDKTIEAWGLGYAPQAWEAARNHFKSRGYTDEDMVSAGLLTQRDDGRVYDRFRHRLMIPIRDDRGRIAGFGARALAPDDVPKYLNSPQTPLFDKSHLLYGLHLARKAIRAADQVVIVEGYLDVIALHQHGYANTVSPMGTALTEHHLRMLKRRTRRIVLALDADAAGDKATLRGLQVARETMDREQEIAFDARGLLRQEARLQADIRVTTLPEGTDPDEVVQEDPAAWAAILEAARPVVVHVMETLAAGRDLDDPKVKTEIAEQVLPLIEDLPNAIERDTYRQQLARLLRVDERALMSSIRPKRTRRRPRRAPASPQQAGQSATRSRRAAQPGRMPAHMTAQQKEAFCLGVLLRQPDLTYLVDRALQKAGLNRLVPADFQYTDHQVLMKLIQEAQEQDHSDPLHVVVGSLPLSLMDLADKALAQTEKLDPNEDRVLEDLLRTLLDLRRRNVSLHINQLRYLMEDSQEQGELIVSRYQKTMLQHTVILGRLHRALGQRYSRAILSG